jgi:sugar lactone lactonase YvrE
VERRTLVRGTDLFSRPAATLVWSDIPNDRVLRWDEASGHVSTFEQPCRNQNGHTRDRQGRLVACEHRSRSVTRIEHDGTRTVVADGFGGRKLNSPNDVIVRSDDSIWFTDPSYGIDSDYEGDAAPMEQDGRHVYRIDPSGALTRVVSDMVQPNGLAFSPDETLLYVTDTGRTHVPDCAPRIRRYRVAAADGRSVADGTDFVFSDAGFFDGLRVDAAGNLWSSAGGRRALLRAGRHPARKDQDRRARREPVLRRPETQPPVPLCDVDAAVGLRERARRLVERCGRAHCLRRGRSRPNGVRRGRGPSAELAMASG